MICGLLRSCGFPFDPSRKVLGRGRSTSDTQRVFVNVILGDLSQDGRVNATDLALVLNSFGTTGTAGDVDGNGFVDASDIAQILNAWNP